MNSMVDLSIVFCKRLPESIPNWSTISRHFNLTRWGPNQVCHSPFDLLTYRRKLGGFPFRIQQQVGKGHLWTIYIHIYISNYIHICKTLYKRSCDRLIHPLWLVHPFSSVRCYHGVSVQGGSQGKQGPWYLQLMFGAEVIKITKKMMVLIILMVG